jgi:hypothetical protein
MDTFVAAMRSANTAQNLKASFAIHLQVDKGVVTARSKPRMAARVPWSPTTILYDVNDVNANITPPPNAIPQTHPRKLWTRLPKILKTLKVSEG